MNLQRETLLCQYRYDGLDRLIGNELAQRRREEDVTDITLLATDVQRSVLHTLQANHQRQPIAYAPYGHRPALSDLFSLLGFNSERPDPLTGHYLLGNGYRAFNPVLMRFNSPDNLSPFGKGGLNSYSYCLGDPINLADPNGHNPILKIMSSALIFSKSRSRSNSVIAFIESTTATITFQKTSIRTITPEGWVSETTTIFDEHGSKQILFVQIGGEITLMHPDKPIFQYPVTPSLKDLAYTEIRPADLTTTRKFASGLMPIRTDRRNIENHHSQIEFNLRKAGIPGSEIAQLSRTVRNYDLVMGNIKGAFPEKLGPANELIRNGL
jgi:RHS repeat-associated protein